jgi:hypothetical protein
MMTINCPSQSRIKNLFAGFVVLSIYTFLSILTACDGDGSGNPTPTPTPDCIDISGGIAPLEEFDSCPAEGITLVCNNLFCDFFEPGQTPPIPPALQTLVLPSECVQVDCFTMECVIRSTEFPGEGDIIGTGRFVITTFLTTNLFSGSILLNEVDKFDYVCNSVVF